MTRLFDIAVSPDKIELLGVIVERPSYVGRSEWVDFWNDAQAENEEDVDPEQAYTEGVAAGEAEGMKEGYAKGIEEAYVVGPAEALKILERLKRRPPV